MITTDAIYNTLIASGSYEEGVTGTLKDGSGATVLNISNEYIKTGSLIIDNKCINNDDLEPGAVYAAELKITITGNAGLTSSQKSSLQNGSLNLTYTITDGNSSSSIPIGIYYIIEVTLKDEDVEIIAEDMMSRLSKNIPTAVREDLNFVARTPYELLDLCCQNCSTSRRPISLANDETEFDSWSNADVSFLIPVTADIATYRDLVAEVAKIMGCFATIDKATNGLILKRLNPHSNSNVWNLNEDIRYRTEKSGYICKFGKVALGNESYPGTSDEDVSGLILNMRATELTDDSELLSGIVQNLYNEMAGISYRPCKIEFMGNIALEVGDWIGVNYTEDETTYTFRTIITHLNWILNGKELIESTGSSAATTKKVGSKGSNESRNSSSIDNLTDRIETLESSGSGNKIYTSVTSPDNTLGNEGDLWVKYRTDHNDKFINSKGEKIDVDIPRYKSADEALAYVKNTIVPQIKSIVGASLDGINDIIKSFENKITIIAEQSKWNDNGYFRITASQFPQLSADTYSINNQSMGVNGNHYVQDAHTYYGFGMEFGTQSSEYDNSWRYISPNPGSYLVVNVNDYNDGMDDDHGAYEIDINCCYLFYNVTTKEIDSIGIYGFLARYSGQTSVNAHKINRTLPDSPYSIDLINTAFLTADEIYCKINDDWANYDSDDGSTVIVNQILQSGTEIAQINGTSLYAPSGGSDVTVTPITTTGTNIANIAVNGTTYNLFAPTSGGGGGGSGSGYTETSLWSGYKSDTGTITLSDSVENYDVILIKVTSHPSQPLNKYYESYFIILPSEINYSQNAQYDILAVREAVDYGNGSIECYFPSSTSFTIEVINIDQSATQVKPAVLEIIGLKLSTTETAFIYSNEERVVGVWTDNRPLYQKTVEITSVVSNDWNDVYYDADANIVGYDPNASYAELTNGERIALDWYRTSSIYNRTIITDSAHKFRIEANGNTYTKIVATIKYTKTTDTPGSAPYVTSGSYAHHYSTDEQVIGTWIDGKTLYERVHVLNSAVEIPSRQWYTTSMPTNNAETIVDVTAINTDGTIWKFLAASVSNSNYVKLFQTRGDNIGIKTIILQYTKTS